MNKDQGTRVISVDLSLFAELKEGAEATSIANEAKEK